MKARIVAIKHALSGAGTLLTTQANARIHALATILVISAGLYCQLTNPEWALIILAIALVWMAEALNTAIEFLANEVSLEKRPRIKHAKDIAAFAVLTAAIAAATIALLIFPHHLK
jgi:diacylglycerol kinase